MHARILKRAAMNQAMLQNVPQQALPNSPRLPRLANPRGTNEKARSAWACPTMPNYHRGADILDQDLRLHPRSSSTAVPAARLGATHGAAYAWDTFFDAAGALGRLAARYRAWHPYHKHHVSIYNVQQDGGAKAKTHPIPHAVFRFQNGFRSLGALLAPTPVHVYDLV